LANIVQDGRITCPWHGACFNASTGDIENAPAIDALPSFELSEKDGSVYVTGEQQAIKSSRRKPNVTISGSANTSDKVVVVGGGSAALSTVESLRENGYKGSITMIGNEGYTPIDRTKLSKALIDDQSKIALRDEAWFKSGSIDFVNDEVTEVDFAAKKVSTKTGSSYSYAKLVLATGGTPKSLPLPGFKELDNIFLLRNIPHVKAINQAIGDKNKKIVIIGSSFIGMEVANAIAKNNDVTVVGMEKAPCKCFYALDKSSYTGLRSLKLTFLSGTYYGCGSWKDLPGIIRKERSQILHGSWGRKGRSI
jgi:NADH dehydrogenase FAD-containing subunit